MGCMKNKLRGVSIDREHLYLGMAHSSQYIGKLTLGTPNYSKFTIYQL